MKASVCLDIVNDLTDLHLQQLVLSLLLATSSIEEDWTFKWSFTDGNMGLIVFFPLQTEKFSAFYLYSWIKWK